jgi:DNA-3-methyladenine glycosylase I
VPSAEKKRCSWVNVDNALLLEYHDREWGVPNHDDRKHFEFLVLEAAQAGLNWSIVLKKREGYRHAFAQFDPEKVARYTKAKIDKLVADPEIIRNRKKIESAVKNARAARRTGRIQKLRQILLAIRRWQAATESLEISATDSPDDRRVRRLQPRSQTARLQLRRIDRDLRAHAGGWNGQRSPGRLLSVSHHQARSIVTTPLTRLSDTSGSTNQRI